MEALLILVAIVVAFIVSSIVTKKIANKIFIITGYNGFASLQRMLCSSMLIILCVVYIIFPDSYSLGLLALVPVVILVLMNLKAKKPAYIITLSVLQVLYGIIWFFVFMFKLAIKFTLKTDFNTFTFTDKPLKDATLERAEWCAKSKGYADVATWVASESGYVDVNSAYEGGFFNGKLY